MCSVQSNPGSIDIREAFLSAGDIGDDFEINSKELINQANTVDLLQIFQHYNIDLSHSNKCKCPFPDHSDKTPSFYYYKNTNSFNCFGCTRGGKAVDFVSFIEGIDKNEAAIKIRDNFNLDSTAIAEVSNQNYDKLPIILQFSENIRNFLYDHSQDTTAIKFAEKITLVFDTLNNKHNLNAEGIKILIEKLTSQLKRFGK